ncbi:MAG: PilW family protein [Limisphaerales bacterium]
MKLLSPIQNQSRRVPVSGFTLVEIMTAMFVFVIFLVVGMITVQMFVLRINNFTTDKLLAAGGSSKAMNQICNKIRSAQFVRVGTINSSAFTPIANGSKQQGTALQVFSTTNSTPYTIFYLNPATDNLYSVTNGESPTSASPGTLLASWITNSPCFWSENSQGAVNTTTNPFAAGENCTIRMVWNFCQYATDRKNLSYEFYTFQTRATPRSPNF